ncbi:hybrid sensor histidine kinase/response regulator [Candidatus Laterigemmans baculatus]|uniref:hybrid sensor histidine kinase/response regulator n=1 Tax=Candidatus Laterigemmans baculatus TaxID=2770505 RepID=UPI0013DD1016|nr:response regulator [Candidatus Laterigemmans baculatus]
MSETQRPADWQVLIVEDDPDAAANIADILELDGYSSSLACSIAEALKRLRGGSYDTIILDRSLPDGQSIESLTEIRGLAPDAAIVIITGHADLDGVVQALRHGASDYILKPLNSDALRATLARIRNAQANAAEIARLSRDLSRRQSEFETLLHVFPSEFAIAIADDPDCQFIHVSESFARMLNIPQETNASLSVEIEGRPDYYFSSGGVRIPADQLPVQQSAMQGRVIQGREMDLIRPDQPPVHLLCYSSPLYDEYGKPRGAVGAFLDVTERRQAAEALEESERRFRAIFDNSMDGLIVMDDESRIVDANPAACSTLARPAQALKQTLLNDMLPCDDGEGAPVPWQTQLARGQLTGECHGVDPAGRPQNIEYRAAANFLPGLHVISLRDVTERKRAEQRLLQTERLAAIGETIAGLAHESRNALQRSRACLELLSLEVEKQPDAIDLVGRVLKAQDRLQELYEEVREYAAPIKLNVQTVDLRQVWRTSWNHVVETHPQKSVELAEHGMSDGFHCPGDRRRLEQIFLNIFENAHQVSSAGGVIRLHGSPATIGDRPGVAISICDEGPGMNREQRERIFEAFFTTKTKGTGLGMAIVKRLVLAHGGHVHVADRDGPGAEIVIVLPTVPERSAS